MAIIVNKKYRTTTSTAMKYENIEVITNVITGAELKFPLLIGDYSMHCMVSSFEKIILIRVESSDGETIVANYRKTSHKYSASEILLRIGNYVRKKGVPFKREDVIDVEKVIKDFKGDVRPMRMWNNDGPTLTANEGMIRSGVLALVNTSLFAGDGTISAEELTRLLDQEFVLYYNIYSEGKGSRAHRWSFYHQVWTKLYNLISTDLNLIKSGLVKGELHEADSQILIQAKEEMPCEL